MYSHLICCTIFASNEKSAIKLSQNNSKNLIQSHKHKQTKSKITSISSSTQAINKSKKRELKSGKIKLL